MSSGKKDGVGDKSTDASGCPVRDTIRRRNAEARSRAAAASDPACAEK